MAKVPAHTGGLMLKRDVHRPSRGIGAIVIALPTLSSPGN